MDTIVDRKQDMIEMEEGNIDISHIHTTNHQTADDQILNKSSLNKFILHVSLRLILMMSVTYIYLKYMSSINFDKLTTASQDYFSSTQLTIIIKPIWLLEKLIVYLKDIKKRQKSIFRIILLSIQATFIITLILFEGSKKENIIFELLYLQGLIMISFLVLILSYLTRFSVEKIKYFSRHPFMLLSVIIVIAIQATFMTVVAQTCLPASLSSSSLSAETSLLDNLKIYTETQIFCSVVSASILLLVLFLLPFNLASFKLSLQERQFAALLVYVIVGFFIWSLSFVSSKCI